MNGWKVYFLKDIFPADLSDHIVSKIGKSGGSKDYGKPLWLPQAYGKFIIGSAWDIIRESGVVQRDLRFV